MEDYRDFIASEAFYKEGCINLMVFPSCSIKVSTTEAIKDYVSQYNKNHDRKIYYPMGETMDFKTYADALEQVEDINQYPDVIIQCEYKSIFAPNFIEFREAGEFIDVLQNGEVHPFYKNFDYQDPRGIYTLIGASFPIFVVDKSILGELPVPRSFKELLDPMYRGKMSIHGHGTSSCDMSIMMHINQIYGKDAMLTFAKSIHSLRHFSQVVKEAGKGKKELPPIGIIPDMFKDLVQSKSNVEVIRPKDGSPLFALWLTVKKKKVKEAKDLINFLTGPLMGQLWASASFASRHPDVNNNSYDNMPVHFIGWDAIYQDIYQTKNEMEDEVLNIIRGYKQDKSQRPSLVC
jgi:ABC-type Fe3+ transport system substrate-binding protein